MMTSMQGKSLWLKSSRPPLMDPLYFHSFNFLRRQHQQLSKVMQELMELHLSVEKSSWRPTSLRTSTKLQLQTQEQSPMTSRPQDILKYIHFLTSTRDYSKLTDWVSYSGVKHLPSHQLKNQYWKLELNIIVKKRKLNYFLIQENILQIYNWLGYIAQNTFCWEQTLLQI